MSGLKPSLIVAVCGALAVAACAPGGQVDSEPLTPKQLAKLDDNLRGLVPEKAERCLPYSAGNASTVRVSDSILLYRQSKNRVYRNDLRGACPGLARDDDIIVTQVFGSQPCSGDIIYLVDRVSGMRGASCVLGDFVPYRKPAGGEGGGAS